MNVDKIIKEMSSIDEILEVIFSDIESISIKKEKIVITSKKLNIFFIKMRGNGNTEDGRLM